MRSIFVLVLLLLTLMSCREETPEAGLLVVKGTIEGLRQGRVLLQRVEDSVIVSMDSVELDGISTFTLKGMLDEPQIVYVHLDLKDGNAYDDRAMIFAEDTIITLTATLEKFEKSAVISGSKNHEVLSAFKKNLSRLNETQTELVKKSMMLGQLENASQRRVDSLNDAYDKYLRKRVLYAINYAKLHKDMPVAPYILLSEGFDANPKLLDSIYDMMPKKVQNSRYGKQLSGLIKGAAVN